MKGDRVAQLMTSRPEYLVVFLATARIGALWLVLNPRYRLDELRYIVGDSSPRSSSRQARIGDRDYRPELETLAAEQASLAGKCCSEARDARSRAISSGSWPKGTRSPMTARGRDRRGCAGTQPSSSTPRAPPAAPKGAMISHHGLVHCSKVQGEQWRTREPVRILCNFPINHVACTGDIRRGCWSPAAPSSSWSRSTRR